MLPAYRVVVWYFYTEPVVASSHATMPDRKFQSAKLLSQQVDAGTRMVMRWW